MKKVFISVITPSFNQGNYIERAIKSFIKQGFAHKEIIVVDGLSTDNTKKILEKYKGQVKWVSEKDKGYADAINKGIRLSKGNIIIVLSSDDFLVEDALEKAAQKILENPDYVMWCGKMIYVNEKSKVVGSYSVPRKITFTGCLEGTGQPQQDTCFFRKKDAVKAKGFPVKFNEVADSLFFLKLLSSGDGLGFSEPISFYQLHGEQATVKKVDKFIKRYEEGVKEMSRGKGVPTKLKNKNYLEAIIKLRQAYWLFRAGRRGEMNDKLHFSFNKQKSILFKKLFLFLTYKKISRSLNSKKHFLGKAVKVVTKVIDKALSGSTRIPFQCPSPTWYLDA